MNWETLTAQNPWWEDGKEIERDPKVADALSRKHPFLPSFRKGNTLILGPRQTGKTTYLKLCIRELIRSGVQPRQCLYFVCNLVMKPEELVEIVTLFKNAGGKYVFFDEVSLVPEWERAAKHLLEVPALSSGVNLYFTGSSTLELQKERFPGRPIRIREFLPLTFREFCLLFGRLRLPKTISNLANLPDAAQQLLPLQKELQVLFNQYLQCGGFLRAAYGLVEEGRVPEEAYQIYWDWIAGDIARLGLSERTLSAVLKGVVLRYSTPFSLSALAKEVEIPSHLTVRDYLELLESLFVLRSCWKGYERAPVFRKERKVYFIDPFLFHLASLKTLGSVGKLEDTPKIVEGVVGEALKRNGFEARFLRKGKELDFAAGGVGIEVKWQEKVTPADFPPFPLKKRILFSKNDTVIGKDAIIPVPLALALLE